MMSYVHSVEDRTKKKPNGLLTGRRTRFSLPFTLHGGMIPFQLTNVLIVVLATTFWAFLFLLIGRVVQSARTVHVVVVGGAFGI